MTASFATRPPRVDIPPDVWHGSGQLAPYIARIAVEHGPIFTFAPEMGPLAGRDVVYMVGPEANRCVLSTHRDCVSHEVGWTPVMGETLGRGLLNMDPPEHTRHRDMMNPAFTAQFMARYLPLMRRTIETRTADWTERGEVDLLAEAREITFDVAAEALVGFHTGPEVDFLRQSFSTLFNSRVEEDETWEQASQRLLGVRAALQTKLLELITERRQDASSERTDDVLGLMVRAHDGQGQSLTDEQLLAHVNILLVAGHETTTTLGAWLLYLLATHPDYTARITAELAATLGAPDVPITTEALRGLPVLTNAIREAGRIQSPVMMVPRGVVRDFAFGGYTVTAGTAMFLAIAACHRLPTVFASPDTFDPDRFAPPREEDKRTPYGLVTFGGGPRICIGVNFAQVELKALAAHVLRRYRLTAIPDRPIVQYGGIIQSLPDGIHVRVEAARPGGK